MKTYYVYMLRCSDNSFYVGITSDPERRIAQHKLGLDPECYTFKRRPVELVHASDFREVTDAIAWEKQLKGWSRAKKRALIAGDWPDIQRLARRQTKFVRASFETLAALAPQDDTLRSAHRSFETLAALAPQDDTLAASQDDTSLG